MLALTQQRGSHVSLRVQGKKVSAFVPAALPPTLRLSPVTEQALAAATTALSQLDRLLAAVPSLDWLFYSAVRKEALLWQQMEHPKSQPATELLSFKAAAPLQTCEVDCLKPAELCYPLNALAHARQAMQSGASPVDSKLLLELHRQLSMGSRDKDVRGGQWRDSTIWLGDADPDKAIDAPSPYVHILPLMRELQEYVSLDDGLPKLVRIGLVHGQMGLIHPFKNANGRVAGAVDLLLLQQWGFLRQPVLHLNLYLRREQQTYYQRMSRLQFHEWDGWLAFFLTSVQRAANETEADIRRIQHVVGSDLRRLINAGAPPPVLKVFCALMRRPVISLARLAGLMKMTAGELAEALTALQTHTIAHEMRGVSDDGVAVIYGRYVHALGIAPPVSIEKPQEEPQPKPRPVAVTAEDTAADPTRVLTQATTLMPQPVMVSSDVTSA